MQHCAKVIVIHVFTGSVSSFEYIVDLKSEKVHSFIAALTYFPKHLSSFHRLSRRKETKFLLLLFGSLMC